MNLTRVVAGSLVSGLLLCFSSCINEDYGLDKEIDTNVQIGTNITLPIGRTDTIRLGQMIPENDMMEIVDGRYVITTSDKISEEIEGIDPIVFENFIPEIKPYESEFKLADDNTVLPPLIPGLEYPKIDVSYEMEIDVRESFNVEETLPEAVKAINYVKFDNGNDKEVEAEIILEVSGVPSIVTVFHLVGVEIQFPSVVDFALQTGVEGCVQDGSKVFLSKDMVLTNGTGRISIPIVLKGLKDPKIENGVLFLSEEVAFSGSFYIDEKNVGVDQLAALENVKLSIAPQVKMATPKVRIAEVSGTVEPKANISTSVSFDQLPEFLQEGTSFGLKEMLLTLSFTNPINAAMEADVVLTAKNAQGQAIDNGRVELTFAAEPKAFTEFVIDKNNTSGVITSGSLVDLLKTVPHSIEVEVTRFAVDCKTADQAVSLIQESYNLEFSYNLQIPMEFDNLQISYAETIGNLQKNLKDIVEWIDCLEIHADVCHTIPMGLSLKMVPRDANGNDIEGISVPEKLVVEAALDSEGTERNTEISILLEEIQDGALKKLDQLYLEIEATSGENMNVVLRPDQYIVLDVSAKLPKGINVNLGGLK